MKFKDFIKILPENIIFENTGKGCPLFKCVNCKKRYRKLSFARSHFCSGGVSL